MHAPVTTRSVDIPPPTAVSRLPECSFCGQSSPSIYSRGLWPGLLLEIQTVTDCTLRRPTALFPPPVPGHSQNVCLEYSFLYVWKWSESVSCSESCLTLCPDPPGSSVCGILQARILEWVAIPFSRASSQPRDRTQVACIASRFVKNCNKKPPPTNLCYVVFILKVQPGSHHAIIQVLVGLCSFWGSRREPVLASSSF